MKECPSCSIDIAIDVVQCPYCKYVIKEDNDVELNDKAIKSTVEKKAKNEKTIKKKRMESAASASPAKVIIRNSQSCILCSLECSNGKILTNGSVYHKSCWERLSGKLLNEENKVLECQTEIDRLKREIKTGQSFLSKLKVLFGANQRDIEDIDIQIQHNMDKIATSQREIGIISNNLKRLYDYWPEYPPDWEERKQEVRSSACEKCGSSYRMLHVHHKIPLSRGGSNLLSNLLLLCEQCHSQKHGNREFDYRNQNQGGAFPKRVSLINSAISNKKIIHFSYINWAGRKSARSIKPIDLRQVGKSLCVHGLCYLRQEERTFSVKRMKGVKIIDQPYKSYFK